MEEENAILILTDPPKPPGPGGRAAKPKLSLRVYGSVSRERLEAARDALNELLGCKA